MLMNPRSEFTVNKIIRQVREDTIDTYIIYETKNYNNRGDAIELRVISSEVLKKYHEYDVYQVGSTFTYFLDNMEDDDEETWTIIS
jgi:hypothetical protein